MKIKYRTNLVAGIASVLLGIICMLIIPTQIAEDFAETYGITSKTVPYAVAYLWVICGIILMVQSLVLKKDQMKVLDVKKELKAVEYMLVLLVYAFLFKKSFLLEESTRTVAGFLKRQGYRTACIGKWHLGLNWTLKDGEDKCSVDFTKPVGDGPTARGFDYFYGISASLDMPPYVYIENDHVSAPPDRIESNEWDRGNSYNKKMFRQGPVGRDFHHEEVLEHLLEKTIQVLEQWKEEPFFVYFPMTAPHGPILPTAEFEGKSGTTEYGDFVLMCDMVVGKINEWLKQHHLEEDTILILPAITEEHREQIIRNWPSTAIIPAIFSAGPNLTFLKGDTGFRSLSNGKIRFVREVFQKV